MPNCRRGVEVGAFIARTESSESRWNKNGHVEQRGRKAEGSEKQVEESVCDNKCVETRTEETFECGEKMELRVTGENIEKNRCPEGSMRTFRMEESRAKLEGARQRE